MALKVIKFDPPLADALVALVDPNTRRVVAGGLTDSQGKLQLHLRKGSYTVIVAHPDYLVYKKDVEVTEDTVLNITLPPIPEVKPMAEVDVKASISVETPSPQVNDLSMKVAEITTEVS